MQLVHVDPEKDFGYDFKLRERYSPPDSEYQVLCFLVWILKQRME